MVDVTMAKKRMGRPKTSERQDVSIKFDRTLARKARLISEGRGISMAEYLSELSRPVIDRDYARLMRDLEEEAARNAADVKRSEEFGAYYSNQTAPKGKRKEPK
jgi:hypothetical protein